MANLRADRSRSSTRSSCPTRSPRRSIAPGSRAIRQEAAPYDRLFRFLVDRNRTADAEALLASYQRAFPADEAWVLKGRADLATRRGATADALAVYDQAFRPLWDDGNVAGIFRAARAHPQPARVSRSGPRRHRRAPGRPDAGRPRLLLLPARRKRRRRRTGARRFRGAPRQRDANGGRAVHAGAPVRENAELQRSAPLSRVDLQPARREPGRRRAGARQHHRHAVHRAGAAAAVRQRRSLVLPRHRDARSLPGFSERRAVAPVQLGLAVEPVRAGSRRRPRRTSIVPAPPTWWGCSRPASRIRRDAPG